MNRVSMKRRGNFLSLVVPGLAERRPSLVHGDFIFVKQADADETAPPYKVLSHLHSFILTSIQLLGNK